MSDLISRSDVLKLPRYHFGTSVSMLTLEEYIKVSDIKKILTAYNVDKVVEELMNHKDTTDLTTVDEEMVEGFTIYKGAFNEAIEDAIEIIKQGSVVSDDVCEWRVVDRPNNFPIYNTSCGKIRLQCAAGIDVYCNGCGKKIKAVDNED